MNHTRMTETEPTASDGRARTGGTSPRRVGESLIHLLLATLLCLGVASPAILTGADEMVGLLVPAAQLTPFVAAALLFAIVRPGGFSEQFALRWGRSWRAIGVGVAAVVVIGLAQLGVGLANGAVAAAGGAVRAAALAVPVLWALQCVFAIGEELGWRGWLVSRMRGFGFWGISAFSAGAWMIWHLPAIPLIVGDGGAEVGVAYLLAIGSWAPFLVALRLWSGSVWPAVVVHGALNSVRVFLTQSVASTDGVDWLSEAIGWILWLAAAGLVWRLALRGRH
ncbi:lysostaphin resistance A-like protein [Microbacterium sp. gxy059]|uniref:CPBP family intramembrane glutamic endopeptidase n=1 Tax=Microbacterium sp. gxy059 TaxID=2957199 RepID=UPI003D9597AD